MVAFAERLAKDKHASLPSGYDKDFDICRGFLDQHLGRWVALAALSPRRQLRDPWTLPLRQHDQRKAGHGEIDAPKRRAGADGPFRGSQT
jgi:hypothetical protein